MDGGYLQDPLIGGIRDFAEEMHPLLNDGVFRQEFRTPVGGIRWPAAIADVIAPHDYHLACGVFAQYSRQCAHEGMKAPVGLQIARHVGDDGVSRLEYPTVREFQTGLGIRPQVGGVDPLVNDPNLVLVGGGMKAVLPARRSNTDVAIFQAQQVHGVTAADSGRTVDIHGEPGVEAGIGSLGLVVVLAEVNQPGLGKSLLDVEAFAPARMGHYHIGAIALALEVQ